MHTERDGYLMRGTVARETEDEWVLFFPLTPILFSLFFLHESSGLDAT